jgi:hypothetical protein
MTFAFLIFEDISWRIIKSQSSFSKRTLWNIYEDADFILIIRFFFKNKKINSQNSFSKRTLINTDLSKENTIYNIEKLY